MAVTYAACEDCLLYRPKVGRGLQGAGVLAALELTAGADVPRRGPQMSEVTSMLV